MQFNSITYKNLFTEIIEAMKEMKSHCLIMDLKDDAALIAEYEKYHQDVWDEVKQSITDSGIQKMEIYRAGNRLVMFIHVTDKFSFTEKAKTDATNKIVQAWEELMWKYQQRLPFAQPGEKWMVANKIFDLDESANDRGLNFIF